jgi:single-stranded-DNA-specific exonuclease
LNAQGFTTNPPSELALQCQLTRTVADWLSERGHSPQTARDWLAPKLAALTPPDGMLDRVKACQRLALAVKRGETIVVFGDYDCDGITSTAILTEVLRTLGGRATPCLANRFDGGYGVSEAAVARILEVNPSLVVTCDCGSSDHASLSRLRDLGVDVIVIDHHLVPEQPLPAVAFLNPHRPECGFPYKYLASCGLVLSIAAGLRKELGAELDVRRWLDLVAIGTVADVAPLTGDNRALVRAGLGALVRTERPGLRLLLDSLQIDAAGSMTGRDIAFRVAPHINAPGRLGAPDLALWVLLARTKEEAAPHVESLIAKSTERRALQEQMVAEAEVEIAERGYSKAPVIVLGRQGWNAGIVGIVAGRIADKYAVPVIVIGFEGDVGRGSVRGPKGARLYDALSTVAQCLERFGGHQAAAGLEVRHERLEALRSAFGDAILTQAAEPRAVVAKLSQVPLAAGDKLEDVLRDLERLEPCGEGNPRPRIVVEGRVVSAREVKGGHLKLCVERAGGRLDGFAVTLGHRAAELLATPNVVRVCGDLRLNQFMGAQNVEMWVEAIEVMDPTP